MANHNLVLTKKNLLQVYFRLSQLQLVGGRLAQVVSFMKRLLAVWPELAPGSDQLVAAELPENMTRKVLFAAEEQNAVADGFIRLLSSGEISDVNGEMHPITVGVANEVLKDVEIFGAPILAHVMKRLSADKVEPFVEDLEPSEPVLPTVLHEDPTPADTVAPAPVEVPA